MNDGWVCIDDRLPKLGDNIELRLSLLPGSDEGTWQGTTKIVALPPAGEWAMTLADGTRLWIRYWRKVQ